MKHVTLQRGTKSKTLGQQPRFLPTLKNQLTACILYKAPNMTLNTPWPICEKCQAIPPAFFRHGAIDTPHQLWPTFSAFANSASRGCHTCTLLYEAVREPFKSRLDEEPVHLERSASDNDSIALTIDPASLVDHETWVDSLQKAEDGQRLTLQFQSIADIKYVLDAKDIPQSARHFKGKMQ
jgi:hypothetical protein